MKKSDLHREWARVLDMCEGTSVSPGVCWTINGVGRGQDCAPLFNKDHLDYKFAVAILEDKPVFVGDKLYCKGDRQGEYIVTKDGAMQNGVGYALDCLEYLSWNPPKKTFMLNGEELPCPVKLDGQLRHGFTLGCRPISFDTSDDCSKVFNFINKLLTDNTK